MHILKIDGLLLTDDGFLSILDACLHLDTIYIDNCPLLAIGEKVKNILRNIKLKYFDDGDSLEYVDYDNRYKPYYCLTDGQI